MKSRSTPNHSPKDRGTAGIAAGLLAVGLLGVGLFKGLEETRNAESEIKPGVPGTVQEHVPPVTYCTKLLLANCLDKETAYMLNIQQCEPTGTPNVAVCVKDDVVVPKDIYDAVPDGSPIKIDLPEGEQLTKVNFPIITK